MKLTHLLSIAAIGVMFAACSKEGPTGPAGANGVANISTSTYSVYSSDWTLSGNDIWTVSFTEPDITDFNNDAVEVYWATPSVAGWLSMPATSLVSTGDELSYGFSNGSITFTYSGNGNTSWPIAAYSTLYFNVVVIPPAAQAEYPNTDWQNASDVYNKVPQVPALLNKNNNR